MPDQPLETYDVLGRREVRFTNRQESIYPNLMRFCLDFKFRVQQLLIQPDRDGDAPQTALMLMSQDEGDAHAEAITPAFDTLEQLERYVDDNQVDILHDYLFGLEQQA